MIPKNQILGFNTGNGTVKSSIAYGLKVRKGVCGEFIRQSKLIKKINERISEIPDDSKLFNRLDSREEIQGWFENYVQLMKKEDLEMSELILEEEGINSLVEYLMPILITVR